MERGSWKKKSHDLQLASLLDDAGVKNMDISKNDSGRALLSRAPEVQKDKAELKLQKLRVPRLRGHWLWDPHGLQLVRTWRKMAEIVKQKDHSEKDHGIVLHLMRASHDLSGNLEDQGHLLDFEGHR